LTRRKQLVFFIDRCLGKHVIADQLRAAGERVEIHDDHFLPDCPDEVWLSAAGAESWIVITKDKNFQKRQFEILAIARSRVRVFQLSGGEVTGQEMAGVLVSRCKKIKDFAIGNPAPFIARINRSGKIQMAIAAARLRRLANR
jgi:predicted nuclease of predicted toxin-antitoxin system